MESLKDRWEGKFIELIKSSKKISIISPYISNNEIVNKYLKKDSKKTIRIITRANNEDFICKISDVETLERIYKNGIKVKIIEKKLHSKLYLFDDGIIITSSNLTLNGLSKNFEYGVYIHNENTVNEAKEYFEDLWELGKILNDKLIAEIKRNVKQEQEKMRRNKKIEFKDWGKKIDRKSNKQNVNESRDKRLYLVHFEEDEHRKWNDARKYGFICAGMGKKFSKDLHKLKPGDKVLVKYLKRINSKKNTGFGYVAYGQVLEEAKMAKEILIGTKQLVDLSKGMGHHLDNKEKCEWVVRVKWISEPLSAENGIKQRGLYYVPYRVVSEIDLNHHKIPFTEKLLREKKLII